ncbi:hypothetical protein OKA05_28055 [Luteolibacter arcticus]|uniref:Chromosome partition protein Smc n=1 Tax=Luteolibacter arcticus TaxID=1581411 RepID=A0ABT3GSH3_9BACT|nr:hypothetical protein [Luteolibacter arcticus]MCW1926437.1 hypothetical protein [Luteolibacter arcticus]
MGFTDLLTSSRGPGVIGTLLALLVLVGFGTLYLFVFDEGLQGGQKKIEAVIRDEGLEIGSLKTQIQNAKDRLEEAGVAKAKAREADELTTRNAGLAKQIEELNAAKTAANEEVQKALADWEGYKDQYRASEWGSAVGNKMDDIKTPSGEVFSNVEVKAVDHTGVRITHSAGSKTIKPEDLPADLFDRFQFDLEKKKAIETAADAVFQNLTNDVELTNLGESGKGKLRQIETLNQEITTLNAAVVKAKDSIGRNQAAIDGKRLDIAREKTKKLSRAPQMQEELRVMERAARESRDSIPANESKIRRAKSDISKLQDEIREIKEKIAKVEEAKKGQNGDPATAPKN